MADKSKNVNIPIIVGVTGHRDIDEKDIIIMKKTFRKYLDKLQEKYSESDIIVTSGLARGCDIFAVEAAKEVIDGKSYKYIALLPMKREFYENDFDETEIVEFENKKYNERELFEKLCCEALCVYEGPYYLDESCDSSEKSGSARDVLYEDQGKRLAEHSDYLVAFFDKNSEIKKGGTAHVLKMRFTGECSSCLNKSELGEMVGGRKTALIEIKRKSSVDYSKKAKISKENNNKSKISKEDIEKYTIEINSDDIKIEENSEMSDYNEFNNEVKKIIDKHKKKSNGEDKVKLDKLQDELDESDEDAKAYKALDYVEKIYGYADSLSMKSKKNKNRAVSISSILIILSIVSFGFYGIFNLKGLLILYMVLYVMIFVSYKYIFNVKDKHEKFVEYRVLAELLRIQYYWDLSGINKQIVDYFPLKSRETMGWIKQALRSIQIVTESKIKFSDKSEENRLKAVCNNWIIGQDGYYKKSINKHKKNVDKEKRIVQTGVILGALLIISVVIGLCFFQLKADNLFILFAISFSGTIIASTALYSDMLQVESFEDLYKRYKMMSKAYDRAVKAISKQNNVDYIKCKDSKSNEKMKIDFSEKITLEELEEIQKVITEIGIEAMNEYSDWLYFQQSKDGKLF